MLITPEPMVASGIKEIVVAVGSLAGTARVVFSNKISSAGANSLLVRFTDADKFDVTNASTSDTNYIQTADPVYRDPSAWYHFVVSVDTTLASGRSKIYANGELMLDVWDDTLESGVVGLVVGNQQTGNGTEFRFNDFAITWP